MERCSVRLTVTVRRYIQKQEQHYRKTTLKVELIALLEKHKSEYERSFWD